MSGMTITCSAKNLLSVAPPTVSPARIRRWKNSPTSGTRPAYWEATTTPQSPSWFQRRSWPVKPIASTSTSRSTPLSQLASRGNL